MNDMLKQFIQKKTYEQTRVPVDFAWTLNPKAYYDDSFYELEQEKIFQTSWITLGPSSQVRQNGDVLVDTVAGHSLFAVRGHDGVLRAFQNVCRHRGTELFEGNSKVKKVIRCPYHGWGFNLKGECVGTPYFEAHEASAKQKEMFDTSHLQSFDKCDFSLFDVKVKEWGGMVFVNLAKEPMDFFEYLGDLPELLKNHKMEEWDSIRIRHYEINANWKLLVENAIEYYHLPWVHPQLAKTSRVQDHHRWQGKGMYCGIQTYPLTTTDDSSWLNLKPLEGLSQKDLDSGYFYGLFPNLIMFIMPSHSFLIRTHPTASNKTIETAWLLSHHTTYTNQEKSVDEVLGFWDIVNKEDIGIVEKIQRGIINKAYPGGRMCYRFEEPVHRFQNMVIDKMLDKNRIPPSDDETEQDFPYIDYRQEQL